MRTGSAAPLAVVGVVLLASGCAAAGEVADRAAGVAATASGEERSGPLGLDTGARVDDDAIAGGATADSDAPGGEQPAANAAALDFTAPRLGGGTVDGTEYAGGDVVLWAWAPWCPTCNREAPHVADVAAEYEGAVTFIGLPGLDSNEAHQAFVDEHGLESIPHAVGDEPSSSGGVPALWARYGINFQPAWVFIDEDGQVETHAGPLYEDLEARVRALVDQ